MNFLGILKTIKKSLPEPKTSEDPAIAAKQAEARQKVTSGNYTMADWNMANYGVESLEELGVTLKIG